MNPFGGKLFGEEPGIGSLDGSRMRGLHEDDPRLAPGRGGQCFEREEEVIEHAELVGGHDERLGVQFHNEIAVVHGFAERTEQTAGAFHEQPIGLPCRPAEVADDLRAGDFALLLARGQHGRQRCAEMPGIDDIQRNGGIHGPVKLPGIAASAGTDGFERHDGTALLVQMPGQERGQDGFAGAGVGGGDIPDGRGAG